MHNKLREIYQAKLEEIETITVDKLPERNVPLLKFSDRVISKKGLSLIAEIKKASPSKGVIRADFSLETIVDSYKSVNPEAISVLTDKIFFSGSSDYLKYVK